MKVELSKQELDMIQDALSEKSERSDSLPEMNRLNSLWNKIEVVRPGPTTEQIKAAQRREVARLSHIYLNHNREPEQMER